MGPVILALMDGNDVDPSGKAWKLSWKTADRSTSFRSRRHRTYVLVVDTGYVNDRHRMSIFHRRQGTGSLTPIEWNRP